MKLKLFRKETWLKKSTWIVTGIFSVTVLGIAIPKFTTKADVNETIKVLEIQPGDKTELKSGKVNGIDVEVTHMSMPEYISTVDEINGKYDAVYIGRDNNGLDAYFDSEKKYRDYTTQFSQGIDELKVNGNTPSDSDKMGYYKFAQRLWYTQSNIGEESDSNYWNKFSEKTNGYKDSETGKNFVEYFAENDITNKRAEEIKAMIDSNQVVYINNKVFSSDLQNSKLYSNFNGINVTDTFQKVDSVSLSDIVNKVQNVQSPKLKIGTTQPQGDNNVNGVAGKEENREMNFTFNVDNPENCKVELYLDYDGDGLFKDNEKVYLTDESQEEDLSSCLNNGSYSLNYKLDNSFVGWLQWKLVVVNDNNQKSYITGSAKFKPLDGKKKDIKVLQIHPKSNKADSDFYLDKDGFDNYLRQVEEYNITYTIWSLETFNQQVNANYDDVYKNYDMLIVGFADAYGGGNTNEFNENALKLIKQFADDGKSLMFTHDTMSLNVYGSEDFKTGPKSLTRAFRDMIGQARYSDPYRNSSDDSAFFDTEENGKNVTKSIPHDEFSNNSIVKSKYGDNTATLGLTLYTNEKMWKDYTGAQKVTKINDAQITEYPYSLGENLNISFTHTQWYQLNLEDPDVVPWYNLDSGKINAKDARNFYYTYSKGNITYSGTGHSNPGSSEDEKKLFVNTIVKCIRGANSAPEITNYQKDGNTVIESGATVNIDDKNEDFEFYTSVQDPDGDRVTIKSVNAGDSSTEPITYDINPVRIESGRKVKVTIPKSYFMDLEKGDKIQVSVKATDSFAPISHEVEKGFFTLVITDDTIEMANVKHGMYNLDYNVQGEGRNLTNYTDEEKLPAINEWFDSKDALDKQSILASSQVSYYATVPFAATVNVTAKSSTLKLSLDYEKDSTNQQDALSLVGDIEVYKLQSDGKLSKLGNMNTTAEKDVYSYDLTREALKDDKTGEICEVVVKYKAKTLVQPTAEEAGNTLISIKNKLQVISKGQEIGAGQLDAQVTIGRVVLDRPLF